jgi:predicted DsbA family dithiol-disulfide isomerase
MQLWQSGGSEGLRAASCCGRGALLNCAFAALLKSQHVLFSSQNKLRVPKMTVRLKIDFVSDVSCPWCVIGLKSLETALKRLAGNVEAEIHFQPFELNPKMGPNGQDIVEHIAQKYGSGPADIERSRKAIQARGVELGFTFDLEKRGRIYNTFDAHRLLHWAEGEGKQEALKNALFSAYFTEGRNPSDHGVLVDVAASVGLDAKRAAQILASDEYTAEVRAREQFYVSRGIHAVPSVIINDRHLIQGGQPAEVFEQTLKELANQAHEPA